MWNHVVAVAIPITAGILWRAYGFYQIPFWIAVAIALASIAVSLRLPDCSATS